MDTSLSIGDFARMTFLSVKTLRHYHEVGLLEPARVDPHSGYRYYRPTQVGDAQLIRRLRELDLPVEKVREVVTAGNSQTRDTIIAEHLDRMTARLRQTQETVDSLRRLLVDDVPQLVVSTVTEPTTTALVVRDTVRADDAVGWWVSAFTELHRRLRTAHGGRTGADGTLFPTEFFTDGTAELVAYVPVEPGARGVEEVPGARGVEEVPGGELAVTTYDGPMIDLDRAYGVLGAAVVERAINGDGPVRERYLPRGDESDLMDHRTVVCWPVTSAG